MTRKISLVVFTVLAAFAVSGVISSRIYAADRCLSCHGNADKLKAMINDDDFNKAPSEGGYG